MHFFDTTFLDAQIDLARTITDYTLYLSFWGSVAFFSYQFVDGLDFFLPHATEVQPEPEAEPQPEAEEPVLVPVPADEWEETYAVPAPGWEPSTAKQAKSLEDILFEPEPDKPTDKPLSFEELKQLNIRKLKKLASGKLTGYGNDPKLTLAQRLAGRIFPQDLQALA